MYNIKRTLFEFNPSSTLQVHNELGKNKIGAQNATAIRF